MKFAGIDVGSRTTKLVVLNEEHVIENFLLPTGIEPKKTISTLFKIAKYDFSESSRLVATGYGRHLAGSHFKTISEVSCHAKGIYFLNNDISTIIDIGGQDSKIIKLSKEGKVIDFVMNDKCAAGTGRFLEMTATIFQVELSQLGDISLQSNNVINIDSTCVVFAESEIISLISQEAQASDIVAAVHRSIANRTKTLMAQLDWNNPVAFTGGVARNKGMIKAIEQCLDTSLFLPSNPSITGALGAALYAKEMLK